MTTTMAGTTMSVAPTSTIQTSWDVASAFVWMVAAVLSASLTTTQREGRLRRLTRTVATTGTSTVRTGQRQAAAGPTGGKNGGTTGAPIEETTDGMTGVTTAVIGETRDGMTAVTTAVIEEMTDEMTAVTTVVIEETTDGMIGTTAVMTVTSLLQLLRAPPGAG